MRRNRMIHTVIGNGQVGKAIYPHLMGGKQVFDKEWVHNNICTPVLHICIPYSSQFVDIVKEAQRKSSCIFTFIHSTVKPGTTAKIGKAAYCPTQGRHADDFTDNMKLYPKGMAGTRPEYDMLDDKTDFDCIYWGEKTEELEYAKIASTNYMYWNIVYQKEIAKYCDKKGYDFHKIYRAWNKSYNLGISVNHPDWQRPVYDLKPEPTPGGHCLPANINIIDDDYISKELRRWQDENM
jgi:hypothetical protein